MSKDADYNRQRPTRRVSLAVRFWSKVAVAGPDECWEWLASTDDDGYGCIAVRGRPQEDQKAHRLAYELTYGPPKLHVLHTCDNPPCCNPAHLFEGTDATNQADRKAKGRHAAGTRNGRAVVNEQDVVNIRYWYAIGFMTQVELAAEFGVHESTIFSIIHRQLWKHVP